MTLKVKLGTRIFPWEDLLVPDQPSPFLDLGPDQDVEMVLAVLSGMGPTVPKMVQLDATGRVLLGDAAGSLGYVRLGTPASFVSILSNGGSFDGGSQFNTELEVKAINQLYNGSTWDRGRSASAANLATQSGLGASLSTPPGMWTVSSLPGAGVLASAVKAAGAAGIRHICTGIMISWGAIAAPVATAMTWVLRDGASGAGTVLAAGQLSVPAAAFQGQPVIATDLAIPGTAATAMTLEFGGALANLLEGATLLGFDAS